MLPSMRHRSGTERVEADMVAASSNHSDGRAAPAALTEAAKRATHTSSSGRAEAGDRSPSLLTRAGRRVMLTCAVLYPCQFVQNVNPQFTNTVRRMVDGHRRNF